MAWGTHASRWGKMKILQFAGVVGAILIGVTYQAVTWYAPHGAAANDAAKAQFRGDVTGSVGLPAGPTVSAAPEPLPSSTEKLAIVTAKSDPGMSDDDSALKEAPATGPRITTATAPDRPKAKQVNSSEALPEQGETVPSRRIAEAMSDLAEVPPTAITEARVTAEVPTPSALSAALEASSPHDSSPAREIKVAGDPAEDEKGALAQDSPSETASVSASRVAAATDDVDVGTQAVPFRAQILNSPTPSADSGRLSEHQAMLEPEDSAAGGAPKSEEAKLEDYTSSLGNRSPIQIPSRQGHSYIAYYAYAEHPPDKKPAEMVLESLKNVPVGTPIQEIKRAADAFGIDFSFMKAVARIESDFNPRQRTGSYIGLFQLSHYEFAKYGSGEITNPRDNAVAAAYKFINDATLFEWDTHKDPTFSDLYLIHQQGWQGAAEHVSHPERIAWKSMCATDEGKEKGEQWCKIAVWRNTLPNIKHIWKTVDNLTSAAFVTMWKQRVDRLYSRYAGLVTGKPDVDAAPSPPAPPVVLSKGPAHATTVLPKGSAGKKRLSVLTATDGQRPKASVAAAASGPRLGNSGGHGRRVAHRSDGRPSPHQQ
jgi:Transglycosylase SLT domain